MSGESESNDRHLITWEIIDRASIEHGVDNEKFVPTLYGVKGESQTSSEERRSERPDA